MQEPVVGIMKMPIGNLQSAWNALCELGFDPLWLDASSDYDCVTHLIAPGVGNFSAVMRHLVDQGLAARIRDFALSGRPTLGICVGMQLLADGSTEGGETQGLGLVHGHVDRMAVGGALRLPHVGWNSVEIRRHHPVFEGLKSGCDFYFVHSYAMKVAETADRLGETTYGPTFDSIVGNRNVVGFQFHPEKSQKNGLLLLGNFCHWDGRC
jgi:glutamine amidotransferase